jgi:cyclic beta-1,2-glucan synthetase
LFSVVRASMAEHGGYVRQAVRDSFGVLFTAALNFCFLEHQTLVMVDAIVRSLMRSFVTGQRLLEWETAAESEMGSTQKTPVELTMQLVPFLSLAVGLIVWRVRPSALPWAVPVLVLWAFITPITLWLNRPAHNLEIDLSDADTRLLRKIAWRTWQYFACFVREENHRLVPDNVQEHAEHEGFVEASRISPTNAGLQLNARQAAATLGYLTVPEYAEQTLQNLRTLDAIPKWNGHLLNWYQTTTLEGIFPYIASTVDSGNFLASLCSLRMGTLELLRTPLLPPLRQGLLDVVLDAESPTKFDLQTKSILQVRDKREDRGWLRGLLAVDLDAAGQQSSAVTSRIRAFKTFIEQYLPWLDPRYSDVCGGEGGWGKEPIDFYTPETSLARCCELEIRLADGGRNDASTVDLVRALGSARQNLDALIENLHAIADISERMFDATDYRVMLDPYRRLLTIGYDTAKESRMNSCYDLLASEARTAMFLAVAKGDVLQDTWFKVGRKTTMIDGNPVLLSWTGTMFEYMMPALWMQTSPETLLAQSLPGAVQAQREHVARERIPWGISEAGYSRRDPQGNYQYHAFGVSSLAIHPPPEGALVIAPYATVLALEADPRPALQNLKRMEKMGWLGRFGFYESADYSVDREPLNSEPYVLVRSWMAHHQGMSLLAITNLLAGKAFQRWFHSDPRVRATELLLHEKPMQVQPPEEMPQTANIEFKPTSIQQ